ncbi:MAG TPA: TRAP transporter substrate-binding protein [Burkholderiales bacterium]|nr:TRAP transporter substrate-binding protein [Burkholderiales bacterium]
MKRRVFLQQAGAGLAAGAIAAPAIADAPSAIRWRMATSWPKSLDTLYGVCEMIAERVGKLTEGKFQIRPYASGEIVPGLQVLDAVQAGTVECGHSAGYYYVGKNLAFAFDTAVPFGLNLRQQNSWMYYGGGLQLLRELHAQYGVVNFPAGNTGMQMGGWFRKEVKSVADLKGLKMRIPGLGGRVLAALGTVPQNLAGADIYPALERGTIDATEWVGPYDDEKLGFYKVAKNYYAPGWWEPSAQVTLLVNAEHWNKLPKLYQEVLTSVCKEVTVDMAAEYDAKNTAALQRLLKAGVQMRSFPDDVMKAAQKASFEIYGEEAGKNPMFRKIYDNWKKFRDEQVQWFGANEGVYERFVTQNKI